MQPEVTLPHEREVLSLLKIAMEAYESGSEYLAVVITDHYEHMRFLLNLIRKSVKWDVPDTKIFRDGVTVKGGGTIRFTTATAPGNLMGLRPTKIFLFGQIGEMYYWMNSMGCPVNAYA